MGFAFGSLWLFAEHNLLCRVTSITLFELERKGEREREREEKRKRSRRKRKKRRE